MVCTGQAFFFPCAVPLSLSISLSPSFAHFSRSHTTFTTLIWTPLGSSTPTAGHFSCSVAMISSYRTEIPPGSSQLKTAWTICQSARQHSNFIPTQMSPKWKWWWFANYISAGSQTFSTILIWELWSSKLMCFLHAVKTLKPLNWMLQADTQNSAGHRVLAWCRSTTMSLQSQGTYGTGEQLCMNY